METARKNTHTHNEFVQSISCAKETRIQMQRIFLLGNSLNASF